MVYSGITACLEIGGKRLPISEVIEIVLAAVKDKSPDELQTLLAPHLTEIYALMDKAERVDELERQVANLEWRSSKGAQNYRQELATAIDPLWRFMQRNAESISEFAAAEQRSREAGERAEKDTD